MNCTIHPLHTLGEDDVAFIYHHATREGSDFQSKILSDRLTDRDGVIALVREAGEIVGWARTESWIDPNDCVEWPTLEALTRQQWRRRGVCRYAVAGLVAGGYLPVVPGRRETVAVFDVRMSNLCQHLRIPSVEFYQERGLWMRKR